MFTPHTRRQPPPLRALHALRRCDKRTASPLLQVQLPQRKDPELPGCKRAPCNDSTRSRVRAAVAETVFSTCAFATEDDSVLQAMASAALLRCNYWTPLPAKTPTDLSLSLYKPPMQSRTRMQHGGCTCCRRAAASPRVLQRACASLANHT